MAPRPESRCVIDTSVCRCDGALRRCRTAAGVQASLSAARAWPGRELGRRGALFDVADREAKGDDLIGEGGELPFVGDGEKRTACRA